MQFEVWLGGSAESAEKSCEVQQMEMEVGVAAMHQFEQCCHAPVHQFK